MDQLRSTQKSMEKNTLEATGWPADCTHETRERMLMQYLEEQLRGVFGEAARHAPISDAAWADQQARHASGEAVDPDCPVNGENLRC